MKLASRRIDLLSLSLQRGIGMVAAGCSAGLVREALPDHGPFTSEPKSLSRS